MCVRERERVNRGCVNTERFDGTLEGVTGSVEEYVR